MRQAVYKNGMAQDVWSDYFEKVLKRLTKSEGKSEAKRAGR